MTEMRNAYYNTLNRSRYAYCYDDPPHGIVDCRDGDTSIPSATFLHKALDSAVGMKRHIPTEIYLANKADIDEWAMRNPRMVYVSNTVLKDQAKAQAEQEAFRLAREAEELRKKAAYLQSPTARWESEQTYYSQHAETESAVAILKKILMEGSRTEPTMRQTAEPPTFLTAKTSMSTILVIIIVIAFIIFLKR